MNNSFLVIDKLNAIFKQCYSILSFKYENSDYVIYYCSEDGVTYTVFVSTVLVDSNNNYCLSEVLHDNKDILAKFVYDFVINFPLNQSDEDYIYNYCEENGIVLTDNISFNSDQCFFDNSIVANTSFNDVKRAAYFYNSLYTAHNIFDRFALPVSSNVWDIPDSDTINYQDNSLNNENINNSTINNLGNMSYILPNVDTKSNFTVDNNYVSTLPVENMTNSINTSVDDNTSSNYLNFNLSNNTEINSNLSNNLEINSNTSFYQNDGNINMNSVNSPFVNNSFDNNYSIDIFSTKNDFNNLNKDNAILKEKNAGFASNKYIIIGTLCLVLAALVVFVSITIVKSL